jgi:hypothetical protein
MVDISQIRSTMPFLRLRSGRYHCLRGAVTPASGSRRSVRRRRSTDIEGPDHAPEGWERAAAGGRSIRRSPDPGVVDHRVETAQVIDLLGDLARPPRSGEVAGDDLDGLRQLSARVPAARCGPAVQDHLMALLDKESPRH